MMNGSNVLAGYGPEGDATIVTLAAAYDEALEQADLLLMPTLPLKPPWPPPNASREEYAAAWRCSLILALRCHRLPCDHRSRRNVR